MESSSSAYEGTARNINDNVFDAVDVPEGIPAAASTNNGNITVTIQPLPCSPQHAPPSFNMQPLFSKPGVTPISSTIPQEGDAAGLPPPYPYSPVSACLPVPEEEGWKQQMAVGTFHDAQPFANKSATAGLQGEHPRGNDGLIEAEEEPVAKPPPQVMTALGPMPLPPDIRAKIPLKFEANPIIEEREIYVAKRQVQERVVEIPHVQYEHRFKEIAKKFVVEKLVPLHKETVKEIPREIFKPVIEEKVIEVPQGVKYVEVPVEVPCLYPPKIVPVPKIQYVERVVETLKPVVKQKIVEVPQNVYKEVEVVKTVEVPYYVPKYVEKIVEIPFKPPDIGGFGGEQLPFSLSSLLPQQGQGFSPQGLPFPPSFAGAPVPPGHPFKLGPMPISQVNDLNLPYEAKIAISVTQPEFPHTIPGFAGYNNQGQSPGQPSNSLGGFVQGDGQSGKPAFKGGLGGLPGMDRLSAFGREYAAPPGDNMDNCGNIQLPPGYSWGAPPNAPPPGCKLALSTCCAPPRPKPLVVTCPPEVGDVKFGTFAAEPDILTRQGVVTYKGFQKGGSVSQLFPPLPPHPSVPPEYTTQEET